MRAKLSLILPILIVIATAPLLMAPTTDPCCCCDDPEYAAAFTALTWLACRSDTRYDQRDHTLDVDRSDFDDADDPPQIDAETTRDGRRVTVWLPADMTHRNLTVACE